MGWLWLVVHWWVRGARGRMSGGLERRSVGLRWGVVRGRGWSRGTGLGRVRNPLCVFVVVMLWREFKSEDC